MPFKEVLAIKQRIVKDLKAENRGRQATTPGPKILQEIDENGSYAWATNNFKAETHYIVEGDKLYADLPDVMQSKGIQKTIKSRVNRVIIYDESPFPGLSPSASNDIFNASFKTLGSALETAISMELREPQATAKSEPRKSQKPTDHEFTEEKVQVEQVTEKNPIYLVDTVMARPIPHALRKVALKHSIAQLQMKTHQAELGCGDAERRMHQLAMELEIARENLTLLQKQ